MSLSKKQIRTRFRNSVFARDQYRCRTCGYQSTAERAEDELDAHHITDRHEMPHGGYVAQNGISLCEECHKKAEATHRGNAVPTGFSRECLYRLIGSSHAQAVIAAETLHEL